MSILDTFESRDIITKIRSWDELKSLVTLDELKRYLRAEYISKESHARYNRRKAILLSKAKELEAQGKL